MEENWKNISGYLGLYQVSDFGNIRSIGYGVMTPNVDKKKGYLRISFFKEGKIRSFKIHRLVMQEFAGTSALQVDHINGIKTDNRLSNLRYCTNRENANYGYLMKEKSSKHIGIYLHRNKFIARIRIGKQRLHLGSFINAQEAAIAYQKKLKEIQI